MAHPTICEDLLSWQYPTKINDWLGLRQTLFTATSAGRGPPRGLRPCLQKLVVVLSPFFLTSRVLEHVYPPEKREEITCNVLEDATKNSR